MNDAVGGGARDVVANGGTSPLSLSPRGGGERSDASAVADADTPSLLVPGNNRRMQKRRAPRRKLFAPKLREAFLEHLACTANIAASAAAVGVSEGCVYRHRRIDPEFREGCWMALEQSVAKLVALRLQRELERADPSTRLRTGAADGDSCGQLSPGLRLDGPPDEKQILDLVKLIQALRDLCRNLSGAQKPGRAANAGVDEVCAALAKRLKAFPPARTIADPEGERTTDRER